MNKIIVLVLFTLFVLCGVQQCRISVLKADKERYKCNTSALLSDVEYYRMSDSLNAAKSDVLSLKIAELEKFRANDLATIESLKIKKRDLEQVTKAQTKTIAELLGSVSDTVIIIQEVHDTVQVLHIQDEWIDFHGVINDGNFEGTLEVRDSLIIVESVKRKRFLGFLWNTNKIISREVDVTSKNPYNTIIGVESILIER